MTLNDNSNFEIQTHRNEYFRLMEEELRQYIDPQTGELALQYAEGTLCPLCGSERNRLLFKKVGFRYNRCENCDLFFVNPRICEDIVIEKYTKNDQANEMWAARVLSSPLQREVNERYFEDQIQLLRKHRKHGRILDIGCGTGDFLGNAMRHGYQALGLEIGEKALSICLEKGLIVQPMSLDHPSLDDERFDVVTMFGVLEHLYHPLREMKRVHHLLKPEGIFLGITPNVYSLAGMVLHERARFFTPRNHPVLFNKSALSLLMQRAGLVVMRIDTVLTGLASVLNSLQYEDPFGPPMEKRLPESLRLLAENPAELEKLILNSDLGLRLRVLAKKSAAGRS